MNISPLADFMDLMQIYVRLDLGSYSEGQVGCIYGCITQVKNVEQKRLTKTKVRRHRTKVVDGIRETRGALKEEVARVV